ncbi:MAG: type II toxin-antitoxin system RelE/ParE family toxin [Bacteroidetes bacterium]|nr:type II toxin-antitoxin system RelE/ParE family toxin [Bacteroidota bacterium]
MTYKVLILNEAKTDFRQARKTYSDINHNLGKRFVVSFKNVIKRIRQNPYLYQIRYDDVRVVMTKTFPYLIHYNIHNNLVIVKAVYHASEDSPLNKLD